MHADVTIDCGGLLLAPGFTDIQCNGALGVDFSSEELQPEGVELVSAHLLKWGVTTYCPTVITGPRETYAHSRRVFAEVSRRMAARHAAVAAGGTTPAHFARSAGLHFEGPFLNPEKKGAHPDAFLVEVGDVAAGGDVEDADARVLSRISEAYGGDVDWTSGEVRMVTLAPEMRGGMDATRALTDRGIVVSIGHTAAKVKEADMAVELGATCITHLFNAMAAFQQRDPGVIGLIGRRPAPVVGEISDDDIQFSSDTSERAADATASARRVALPVVTPFSQLPQRAAPLKGSLLSKNSLKTMRLQVSARSAAPIVPRALPCEKTVTARDKAHASRPFYGLICDGVHVHPYAVSMAGETHPAGLVLVTDAMSGLGFSPGTHKFGEQTVRIFAGSEPDAVAKYAPYPHAVIARSDGAATETLAGVVVSLPDCINNFLQFTGAPLEQALNAVTRHPAELIGVSDTVGQLRTGAWADFVLLERVMSSRSTDSSCAQIRVLQTWLGGSPAFTAPARPSL